MKKYISYLFLLLTFIFVSCKDDGIVSIKSLNTFGSKVHRNEKVRTFVSVETNDPEETSYEWGCTGGALINPPGLFENLWQAPNEPGEYEIWVKVECNGEKQTRRSKIQVLDELFYSNFESPFYSEAFNFTNVKAAFDKKEKSMILTPSSDRASVTQDWSNANVLPPFSMQAKLYEKTFKSGNTLDIKLSFDPKDGAKAKLFGISFSTEPYSGKYKIISDIYNKENGLYETVVSDEGQSDVLKALGKWMYLSFTIDANNKVIIYGDGNKLLESDVLSNYPQDNYPIKSSGFYLSTKKSSVLVDDLFILDNGEICTGTERIR